MIFRAMKSHANEHTIRGRPTLKGIKGLQGLRESNLRANILSEFIKNYVIPKELSIHPGLQTLQRDKKHLRSVLVFSDVIMNQVGFQHELRMSEQQEQKG